jgi:hypothetical protein
MLTSEKPLKRKKLRYAEYYDMTEITDRLYRESKEGKVFCNLMELITSQENIKLAYRSIKRNSGTSASFIGGILPNSSHRQITLRLS